MATLTDHLIKLTDHRERDLLELTLAKALIDLLPVQRVIIAKLLSEDGVDRWMEVVTLDVRGGGKVVDPLRVEFATLPLLEDFKQRAQCLRERAQVVFAWAGEDGPRITYLPLLDGSRDGADCVVEFHSGGLLSAGELEAIGRLQHVFRNMFHLLAYSDRDGLTGLLNRKSLDDTFYSAVLDELEAGAAGSARLLEVRVKAGQERRHRVPPNYWLGTVSVDGFSAISDKHGHLIAEEVLLLVARVLANTFRTYDRLYRLGGEQFAVLMHCPDEALVLAAFERCRANVAKFNFPQVGTVTVCGGFTRVSADDSPSTALERAERAVDYAQHQGGDRVAGHADLVRRGLLDGAAKVGAIDIF
jgi:diguanylate cyclase (GGDEF)-like protein